MLWNEYVGLWGRYTLKQGNPLHFFQNTNTIIFVTLIPLFFDLLYQRGYHRLRHLVIEWKSSGLWGIYGSRHGNPLHLKKHWSNCICFILFFYFWFTVTKRLSKAIYLDIILKKCWPMRKLRPETVESLAKSSYF